MIITNELEPLSNDLTTLTTEIKTYQSIGGQSIFEIGRRLNWVKQNNLTHGEFGKWLESIKMDQNTAERFMKIDNSLSNSDTYQNLGYQALYLIATLPVKERGKPQRLSSGEIKRPDEMTVRELRETKKKLKQREQEISDRDAQIADQQAELEENRKTQIQLNNQLREVSSKQPKPKVITKTVTKEILKKPDDYDGIKSKLAELKKQSAKDKEDIEYYKRELSAAERINKSANGYDELQKKELERKKRQAEINGYSTSLEIDDWVPKLQKLGQSDIDQMGDKAQENLRKRLDILQQAIDRLNSMIGGRRVIEGEYE